MHRLTAGFLLALFCLIPAAPLWSAPSADDTCCCGKKGAFCCRRMHLHDSGPQFTAGVSCGPDCLHGMAGVQSAGAALPAAAYAVAIATIQTNPLSLPEFFGAGISYFAFLYQRPPPALG